MTDAGAKSWPTLMVRAIGVPVAGIGLAASATSPTLGPTAVFGGPKLPPCRVTAPIMPHFSTPKPWRWLGQCPNGRAGGLGVLEMGSGENVTPFVGRMRDGRPVAGMLEGNGPALAKGFTAAGVVIQPDGDHPDEHHAVFVLASRAALATSQGPAAHGNRASAAYYRDLAKGIRDGEPE